MIAAVRDLMEGIERVFVAAVLVNAANEIVVVQTRPQIEARFLLPRDLRDTRSGQIIGKTADIVRRIARGRDLKLAQDLARLALHED